jgi:hypothetical protein
VLYRKAISEKSDDEIFALAMKQCTEAAIELRHSVERTPNNFPVVSSDFLTLNKIRRKMSV